MKKKEPLSSADLMQDAFLGWKLLPQGFGYRHGLLFAGFQSHTQRHK
jgi:hypothetical protein